MSKRRGLRRVPDPGHPWYSAIVSPVLAVLVSAALALGPAPVRLPDRFPDIKTHLHDLAGQKKYRDLAAAGAAAFERRDLEPYQRRAMAFLAIRGLHGVYEETRQVSSLCDAGRLMRRVQAEVGFAEDVETATRLRAATDKLLARTGAKDPCPRARPAKSSPRVVAAAPLLPPAASPLPPSATDPGATDPAPAAQETGADDRLLAVARRSESGKDHVYKDMFPKPAQDGGRAPSPTPERPDSDTRADRLLHGGLASLALGAVGGVGLGVNLYYQRRASDTIDALRATADMHGESTPEEYARAGDLNESYKRLTVAAGVSGALAGLGVLGAVTLFALRARRGSTLAGPWVGPAGAGLTIRGRF
jgi:hypothetical protein